MSQNATIMPNHWFSNISDDPMLDPFSLELQESGAEIGSVLGLVPTEPMAPLEARL